MRVVIVVEGESLAMRAFSSEEQVEIWLDGIMLGRITAAASNSYSVLRSIEEASMQLSGNERERAIEFLKRA